MSAPARAARRSAWRRETPSKELPMPEGRLILFIRAKSTPDCRIGKYYRSPNQKLTNGRGSLAWSISLIARSRNDSVIRTGNGELPVRLIARGCLPQYAKARQKLFSSFFANTYSLGGAGPKDRNDARMAIRVLRLRLPPPNFFALLSCPWPNAV